MFEPLNKLIQDAAFQYDAEFRNDYSGRAMYGSRCVGIVGDIRIIQLIITDVQKAILDTAVDAAFDCEEGQERSVEKNRDVAHTYLRELNTFRWDNMGREMIFYWPDIDPIENFEVENEDYDEEDEDY